MLMNLRKSKAITCILINLLYICSMNLIKGRYYKLKFAAPNGSQYNLVCKYRGLNKYGKLIFERGTMEYLIDKDKFQAVLNVVNT